jgi:ligand-binding sensor domain-containing protein/serine phosphatase RsbU (regulator of sigma subunit)
MKLIFRIFLFLFSLSLFAQETPMKYYTVKEGLANSLVPSIFQDKQGNLWFPTLGGGVSKFNGSIFKTYGAENGLANQMIRAVTEDSNGRILFGSMGSGVFYIERDSVLQFNNDSLPKEIFALQTDKNGIVWAATNGGVFQLFGNDSIVSFSENKNLPNYAVTHINCSDDGDIWFAYDSEYGLYRFSKNKLTKFDKDNGLTNGRILNSFHDSEKNTWVTTDNGLFIIKHNSNTAEKIENANLPPYYLFEIVEPKKGLLLIGSQLNGLLFFDVKKRKVIKSIGQKNGLKSALIFRTFLDQENNVWFSNWGDGVARLQLSGFTKYEENSGIKSRIVYNIQKTDNGLLCATSSGISLSQGKSFLPIQPLKVNGTILQVFKNKDEIFCARERDLLVINGNSVKTFTQTNLQSVKGITSDNHGNVYVAGWGGSISIYNGKDFNQITDTSVAGIKYYYCAFTDSKGKLWFGSWDAGLVCFDGAKWTRYSQKNGLPSDKITSVTEDKQGNIIIGTNGGGFAIYDGSKFKIINSAKGLPSNSVYAITVDEHNTLWIGFQGIIASFNLKNNEIKTFSNESGFDGDVMFNAITADHDTLWIGTNNYLWKYVPKDAIELNKNLRIFIKNLKVNYNLVSMNDHSVFAYNENKISFEYFTTQIFKNTSVKYSYRLLGADTTFSPLTNQNEITFQELANGTYTFEVKACIGNDCSDITASYQFTINPPFWKTWWFLTFCIVGMVILVRFYIRFREQKLKEKQRELEEIVTIRTQEISNQKEIVEHQKELVQEKQKEIIDSITYAKRLQQAILPPQNLITNHLPNNFVLYHPKDIVAGDFYWMHVEGDLVFIAAADSTGHGVPGAMVSIVCSNALEKAVNEFRLTDTGEILDKTTDLVLDTFAKSGEEIKDGMDISLLGYNKSTKQITWSGANNQLWYIINTFSEGGIQEKELIEIKADKQPIGKSDHRKNFTTHYINYQEGIIFYLMTDGYPDQFGGPKGKKFKYKQLEELLISNSNNALINQKDILSREFELWRGDLEQVDDVTIIGIKL